MNPNPNATLHPEYTVGNSVVMTLVGHFSPSQRVYPLQLVQDDEVILTVAYIPDVTNAWDIADALNQAETI